MFRWLGTDKVIGRAFAEATKGSVDDALALLRQAASESDGKGERAQAIGTICYQNSRWQDAATAFEQSLAVQPRNMMRLYFLASALSRAGDWDRAVALLERAAGELPTDVAPLSAKCLILADKPDYDAARRVYEQARHIFAQNPAQEHYSMGLLQQCVDVLTNLPAPTR